MGRSHPPPPALATPRKVRLPNNVSLNLNKTCTYCLLLPRPLGTRFTRTLWQRSLTRKKFTITHLQSHQRWKSLDVQSLPSAFIWGTRLVALPTGRVVWHCKEYFHTRDKSTNNSELIIRISKTLTFTADGIEARRAGLGMTQDPCSFCGWRVLRGELESIPENGSASYEINGEVGFTWLIANLRHISM